MKQRYTDDDRANALAALAANEGNVALTARQVDIPATTIRQWAKGQRHPESAQMSDLKKGDLADELERIASVLLGGIAERIEGASLKDVAVALGICVDKMALLREIAPAANEYDANRDRVDLSAMTNEELQKRREELIQIAALGSADPPTRDD